VGVGKAVNLVEIDCMKFSWASYCIHLTWSLPLLLAGCLFLLYEQLGWPAFMGLVVMVVTAPPNAVHT